MTVRTQTNAPGTVVSDDAVGTLVWSNPGNATADDGTNAEADNSAGGSEVTSEYLKATNFGFNVPSTALVLGRQFNVDRVSSPGLPSFVGSTKTGAFQSSGTLTVTCNTPAGVEAGDTLIAFLTFAEHGRQVQSNPGWVSLSGTVMTNITIQDADHRVNVFARQAVEMEPSSHSFVIPSDGDDCNATLIIAAYRNVDHDNIQASTFATSSSDETPGASLTVAEDGSTLVYVLATQAQGGTGTLGQPSGFTERQEGTINSLPTEIHAALSDLPEVSAGGTTRSGSVVTVGGLRENACALLALPPGGAAHDERVSLVLADGAVGDIDEATADPWSTVAAVEVYGGPNDLWSEDLDPDDINDEDAGIVLAASLVAGATAEVDYIESVVTYDAAVDISVTSPAAAGTVTQPGFTAAWDFEFDGAPATQNDYRVRIYAADQVTVVYDSGVIASATQSHTIGSGTPDVPWHAPADDTTYYLRVTGTEDGSADSDGSGDNITGDSGFHEFDTDWTPPDAITGLTATPVTEEA